MEMIIHLHPDVFEIVKNKTKDIEVRVNDEKRISSQHWEVSIPIFSFSIGRNSLQIKIGSVLK